MHEYKIIPWDMERWKTDPETVPVTALGQPVSNLKHFPVVNPEHCLVGTVDGNLVAWSQTGNPSSFVGSGLQSVLKLKVPRTFKYVGVAILGPNYVSSSYATEDAARAVAEAYAGGRPEAKIEIIKVET